MDQQHLLTFVAPLVVAVVYLPMALGKVPPKGIFRFLGLRTSEALSSPDIWYPANRMAGRYMIAAAMISLCFNVILLENFPEWPAERMESWMKAGLAVPVLSAAALAYLYSRRL